MSESNDRKALRAYLRAVDDGGVSMADLGNIAEQAARAALALPDPTERLARALRDLLNCCQCANQAVLYEATSALAAHEHGIETPRGKWGIWCETWGGMTGSREGWMKINGVPCEFATEADAKVEAARQTRYMQRGPRGTTRTSYRYSARLMVL